MPTKSAMIVSSGSITPVAINRGVTSFCTGSVPNARMASICSVTFIEPNSLAIPEALRPATISAVNTGPSSRTSVDRNQRARLPDLSVLRQRARHLQRHHRAAEESCQDHDRQLPTPIVSIWRMMSSP